MTDHSASPDPQTALNEAWKTLIAEALRRNVVVAVGEHRAAVEQAVRAALQASPAPEGLRAEAALELARLADEDAFLCDFGGQTAVNLPGLDRVIVLGPAALQASPAPLDHYWQVEGDPGVSVDLVMEAFDAVKQAERDGKELIVAAGLTLRRRDVEPFAAPPSEALDTDRLDQQLRTARTVWEEAERIVKAKHAELRIREDDPDPEDVLFEVAEEFAARLQSKEPTPQ